MMPASLFDSTKSLLDKTLPTASEKLKEDILSGFDKKVKAAAKGDFEYQKKMAPDDPKIAKLADAREKLFDRQVEIAGEVSAKMKGKNPDEIAAEIERRLKTDPKCAALQKEIDSQKAAVRGGKASAPSNANGQNAQTAQVQTPAQTAPKQAQGGSDEDRIMKSKMHHLETWSLEIDAVKCMDKVIEADGTKFNSQKMQAVYGEYLKLSKLPYAPDFATYLRRNYPDIISDPDPQLEKANIERVFAYVEYDKKRREIEALKAEYAKELKADPKLAEFDKTIGENVKKRRLYLMGVVKDNEDFWLYTLNSNRRLVIDTFELSRDARLAKDIAALDAKYKAEYAAMTPAQRGKMNYDDFIWVKRNTPDPKSTERDNVVKTLVINKMMFEYSGAKLDESLRQVEALKATGSILLAPSVWDAGAPYRKIQKDEMSPGTSVLYEKK